MIVGEEIPVGQHVGGREVAPPQEPQPRLEVGAGASIFECVGEAAARPALQTGVDLASTQQVRVVGIAIVDAPCPLHREVVVSAQTELAVGAPRDVVSVGVDPRGTHDAHEGVWVEDPATDAGHAEVLRRCRSQGVGVHVQQSDVPLTDAAHHAGATEDGHGAAVVGEPDAARMEEPAASPGGEVEDAAPLLEEAPLLGKEEGEAIKVDLLIVRLDLREVRVHRHVRFRLPERAYRRSRPISRDTSLVDPNVPLAWSRTGARSTPVRA